jgi:hypothetical protein
MTDQERITALKAEVQRIARHMQFSNTQLGDYGNYISVSDLADLDVPQLDSFPLIKEYRENTAALAATRAEITRLEAVVKADAEALAADRTRQAKADQAKAANADLAVAKFAAELKVEPGDILAALQRNQSRVG